MTSLARSRKLVNKVRPLKTVRKKSVTPVKVRARKRPGLKKSSSKGPVIKLLKGKMGTQVNKVSRARVASG